MCGTVLELPSRVWNPVVFFRAVDKSVRGASLIWAYVARVNVSNWYNERIEREEVGIRTVDKEHLISRFRLRILAMCLVGLLNSG